MIGTTTAAARVLLASLWLAAMIWPTQSQAEFRGKGSVVGRILSDSVAVAAGPLAPPELAAGTTAGDEAEEETEPPITRDALNALMKHPTEPVYDPLRPMSGRWVRCRPNAAGEGDVAAARSLQDRYSSSDRTHFTHTIARASDSECKTVVSQERATFECVSASRKTQTCTIVKREAKFGTAAWTPVKLTGDEKPISLSFNGTEKKKKRASAKPRDPRKLEMRLDGEVVSLEFELNTPSKAHKPND